MNRARERTLNEAEYSGGPVLYWMDRDQRVSDNWALWLARERAQSGRAPLAVAVCLDPEDRPLTARRVDFKLGGFREVEKELRAKDVPLFALVGDPLEELQRFIDRHSVGMLVTDFSPLREARSHRTGLARTLSIPLVEVDTHNIVPCWVASQKKEFAARTFRPKIHRLLQDFLEDFPTFRKHRYPWPDSAAQVEWDGVRESLSVDESVGALEWIEPGPGAALEQLDRFIEERLARYDEDRNDPNAPGQSNLSPYLNFGHLSAQRVALELNGREGSTGAVEDFLEELIVRRELSDNFCYYEPEYDSFAGFPDWARQTLDEHREDDREYRYGRDEFEKAETHEDLWNAAQREMVDRGKMHGYLRMYWGKKILEWSESPEAALETAIYLNDRYELDGVDPNGYTGVAWSIGGVHDRAWAERPVFGKIRYMNRSGSKSKFDVDEYVERHSRPGTAISS